MKLQICFGLFLGLGIAACVLALISKYIVLPKTVNDEIGEAVALVNGTGAYDRWKTIPLPIIYKAYFFNVTNPDDVMQGEKPILQEVGPYVYKQYRSKFNITEDGDTLSYNEHQLFEFDENSSYPLTDSDAIRIVNLPLMAMIATTEREVPPLLQVLDRMIPKIFNNPKDLFLTTTPRNFLFDGVILTCDTNDIALRIVCGVIEKLAPRTIVRRDKGNFKFSLLSYKNDTDEGTFVVNSGKTDPKMVGQLSSWNGYSMTNVWLANSSCNAIYGSDATIYAPFQTTESIVNTFSVDLCRPVSLEYLEAIEYSGIDGLRFIARKSTFSSPQKEPLNECYCLNKTSGILGNDKCLLDGALELLTCHGAPIVFTHPHFYLTHEVYQRGVQGLNPIPSKHQNYIDLQPNTGAPLRGSKRGQFNIFLRQVDKVSLTSGLNTTLMPILWFDEGVELSDEFVDQLKTQLLDNLRLLDIVSWAVFAFGGAICIVSLIALFCCWGAKKK
ncbi:sensory neuron membrane protein 2 [Diachasma alloeum]|uniref:sensory neuron membrane protein 2 n=1 Tax=Diachasma alloeum TaxID=454923 RepID=UPI00073817A8|nr:sensory neuron membrane protein 2 [Diachasma alloeum]